MMSPTDAKGDHGISAYAQTRPCTVQPMQRPGHAQASPCRVLPMLTPANAQVRPCPYQVMPRPVKASPCSRHPMPGPVHASARPCQTRKFRGQHMHRPSLDTASTTYKIPCDSQPINSPWPAEPMTSPVHGLPSPSQAQRKARPGPAHYQPMQAQSTCEANG